MTYGSETIPQGGGQGEQDKNIGDLSALVVKTPKRGKRLRECD